MAMIARDEERCIGRALASLAPFVDRMVVVDTGSTDRTRTLARECGAEVYEFAWRDDFAAAKNYALAMADGANTVVMDADEWLIAGGEELRAWAAVATVPTFGAVLCSSTTDAGGDRQEVTDELIRLLPAGARFEGRVHEQPVGDFPVTRTSVRLAHDGYLEAQRARKVGRNERLLRAELAIHRDDGYLWYQLACALATDGRHREACETFERARHLLPAESPQTHPLAVRYLYSLGRSGRFDDAAALFTEESQRWSASPDLYFVFADVLLDRALTDPVRGRDHVSLMRACWRRCVEIGDRSDLPGSVHGRGSFLARRNLALLHDLEQGRTPISPTTSGVV